MAYFAILRNDPADDFEIIACHINLWSLSASFKRRIFMYDVGLRLKAGNKDVTKLAIALPVGTYNKNVKGMDDLSDLLLNRDIAELIFGKPVKVDQSKLKYTSAKVVDGETGIFETELQVLRILETGTILEEDLSGRNFSFWTLQLTSPIHKGQIDSYLRVRFLVRDLGRTWTWKKSCGVKNGALIDLRIADIRGSFIEMRDWRNIQDKIVPIKQLSLFVIAPSWLQLRAASPEFHYMRIFEGRVWEPYLKRLVDLKRKEKLIIYQWRNTKPVDTNNSFHVLLDLSEEFGLLKISNHLMTAALVWLFSLITGVLILSYPSYAGYIEPFLGWVYTKLYALILAGGLSGLLGLLLSFAKETSQYRKTAYAVRDRFLQWEQRRYRKNLQN